MVVVGGVGSNNTRELVATCRTRCPRVHHVQTAADLRAGVVLPADTVGLTAGTSTPDVIIDGVEARLSLWAEAAERALAAAARPAAPVRNLEPAEVP